MLCWASSTYGTCVTSYDEERSPERWVAILRWQSRIVQNCQHCALQSLRLRQRRITLVNTHPDIAQTLNNLAAARKGRGHFDDAESLYRRSIAIYEGLYGFEDLIPA
jgi:hypothetical protein